MLDVFALRTERCQLKHDLSRTKLLHLLKLQVNWLLNATSMLVDIDSRHVRYALFLYERF